MMPLRLLVVDDSSIIRRVVIRTLKMVLSSVGDIFEAANGVEALAILEDTKVDLILTDINMDDMGGIELISRVKAADNLKEIPIVVISTEGNENRVSQLIEQGAVGYIKKPFTPEQIRDTICEIVGATNE
jgi:two-component system, chemotaxis family, chemotaxis protein CheY